MSKGKFVMNRNYFLISMLCLGLFLSAGISLASSLNVFAVKQGIIKIAGGTAHIPVMKEAARRIMTLNPKIVITIAGGGSGLGIKQVGEGLVNIGNSGRKAKAEEQKKYHLKLFKWAIDGVGVVVNPENQVHSLSSSQLKDIFSGKINNWKILGGANHSITIYTRDESSGTRAVFWKKGLGKGAISKRALFIPSNGAMKTAVANDPYGIGYVSIGHMDQSVSPVELDGVTPSLENVKQGKYQIVRGLYSITRGEPNGLSKLFISYLFSPEGQQIVQENGFIPVN